MFMQGYYHIKESLSMHDPRSAPQGMSSGAKAVSILHKYRRCMRLRLSTVHKYVIKGRIFKERNLAWMAAVSKTCAFLTHGGIVLSLKILDCS